jgi:hypothetical protein
VILIGPVFCALVPSICFVVLRETFIAENRVLLNFLSWGNTTDMDALRMFNHLPEICTSHMWEVPTELSI